MPAKRRHLRVRPGRWHGLGIHKFRWLSASPDSNPGRIDVEVTYKRENGGELEGRRLGAASGMPQACGDFLHRHARGVEDRQGMTLEQRLGGGEFVAALRQAGVAAVGIACLADGSEPFRRQGQRPQSGQVGEQDVGQACDAPGRPASADSWRRATRIAGRGRARWGSCRHARRRPGSGRPDRAAAAAGRRPAPD